MFLGSWLAAKLCLGKVCSCKRHFLERVVKTFAHGHAAAALDRFLTLVDGATWSMCTTTLSKGSSYAATAAPSPRVDVEKTPQAAAASKCLLASSGHVWTEFRGLPGPGEMFQRVEEEGKHGGGKWEKLDSFFVFVVSLEGSSVQVRVEGSDSYESLAAKVAAKMNISERHWYLSPSRARISTCSSSNLRAPT